MAKPAVAGVGVPRDSVQMGAEELDAVERGFSVRLVGVVNFGMRKGKSERVHRVGYVSHGWGVLSCWSGSIATVKATVAAYGAAAGAAAATTSMVPAGRSLVMNLGQVLN